MAKRRAKKQGSDEAAATSTPSSTPSSLKLPKGFKRPESISAADAHHLVATTAASFSPPQFICIPTGPDGPCLRFFRDPNTGAYTIPPGGQVIDCADCKGHSTA